MFFVSFSLETCTVIQSFTLYGWTDSMRKHNTYQYAEEECVGGGGKKYTARLGAYATIQPERKLGKTFRQSTVSHILSAENGWLRLGFICCPIPLIFCNLRSLLFIIMPYIDIPISLLFFFVLPNAIPEKNNKFSCLVPKISILLQYLRCWESSTPSIKRNNWTKRECSNVDRHQKQQKSEGKKTTTRIRLLQVKHLNIQNVKEFCRSVCVCVCIKHKDNGIDEHAVPMILDWNADWKHKKRTNYAKITEMWKLFFVKLNRYGLYQIIWNRMLLLLLLLTSLTFV